MNNITYHNKDVASKTIGDALIGKSLAPFGLPDLNIIGILPTNLPAVESNELRLDNLFLLSDGSIAIIDYESEYSRENFVKYINYVARVKMMILPLTVKGNSEKNKLAVKTIELAKQIVFKYNSII